MPQKKYERLIIALSVPLALLLILVSSVGILTPDFYSRETFNWATQCTAQDIADLFIISPLLIISSYLTYKESKAGMLIWSGIIVFLIYTFSIYCFAVHFNSLFIFYCLVFGLSVYSFAIFLYCRLTAVKRIGFSSKAPVKETGIFLIFLGVLFYFLWLSEIVPAVISRSFPKGLTETGLLTNPVHVIDIAVCLPGLIITGILLLKKKHLAVMMATPLLVFCATMSVSILVLIIVMKMKGLDSDLTATAIMGTLTLISLLFLTKFIKSIES
jgi:hypothetical protein